MRTKYKFHAVAISILCVVIIILYELIGPKPVAQEVHTVGDRYISIYGATWGLNCNSAIAEILRARESVPLPVDANGKVLPFEKIEPIKTNNALTAVSDRCNGQTSCSLQATSDELGIEPISTCNKKLTVQYRCYAFDKLNTVDVEQGHFFSVDCLSEKEMNPVDPNAAKSTKPATPAH